MNGLLYVVFGEQYDRLAAHTIAYSRQFTNLPICVLTNVRNRDKKWNQVLGVSFQEYDLDQNENRDIKTSMINRSPFDKTIYLDCDSVVQKPGIDSIFDLLTDKDMVLNLYLIWKVGDKVVRLCKKHMIEARVELPLKVYNGAFICFKKNSKVQDFFVSWNDLWKKTGRGREMFVMACAIKKSSLDVMDVTTIEHRIFSPNSPLPDCIIQHNYNSYGDKDFFRDFNLPRIRENKPFDGDSSDWNWVEF